MAGLKPASLELQGKQRQTTRQEAGKKKRGPQKPRRPKMDSGEVLDCTCHHTIVCLGAVNAFHAVPQHMRPSRMETIQLQFAVQGRKRLSRGLCCPHQGSAQSRTPNHPVRSVSGDAALLTWPDGSLCCRQSAALCTDTNPAHGLHAAGTA